MKQKNAMSTISEAVKWYSETRPIYEQLSKKVETIIQEIINDQKIHIHAIYCRAKEIESFTKKIEDPKYSDPINQITDFSGIRVITYVESDLELVCNVLESHFEIDKENSIDKSKSLGIDKVGYRSIHYVCKLHHDRLTLPEYKKFKGLFFEIQVRTILQHAWAEIEHDKDYKFSGELPAYLKRRFKVLAGVLELADREFNQLAIEIDKYSASVSSDTKQGKLDILIDSTSMKSYLDIKFSRLLENGMESSFYDDNYEKSVLDELKVFGVNKLKDLDDIIPHDFIDRVLNFQNLQQINYSGLLRDLMMIADVEKYFNLCWRKRWSAIDKSTIAFLNSYKIPIEDYIEKCEMIIIDNYD